MKVLSVSDYYIGCAKQNQLRGIRFAECSICVIYTFTF